MTSELLDMPPFLPAPERSMNWPKLLAVRGLFEQFFLEVR
jgi:hypothetical protein